ncbi:hypothetical protein MP228_012364 [Amoeboaphelidium protococcarum]|nr:hypothetical protein MP228_012364 [Amoeboaphelidium protococcarum]
MVKCKFNCNFDEWVDFIDAFKVDCKQLGLVDAEKADVFWRLLSDHSHERIFFSYLRGIDPEQKFDSLLQSLTKLKVAEVNDDYWKDQIAILKPQQENEMVSSFAARYLRLSHHYEAVLGGLPPLRHFKSKLKSKIKDQLVGSTNVETFDKLLLQSMRIESDLRLIKPQRAIDQALLTQAQSSTSGKT